MDCTPHFQKTLLPGVMARRLDPSLCSIAGSLEIVRVLESYRHVTGTVMCVMCRPHMKDCVLCMCRSTTVPAGS